jgi:hypothetical protein
MLWLEALMWFRGTKHHQYSFWGLIMPSLKNKNKQKKKKHDAKVGK